MKFAIKAFQLFLFLRFNLFPGKCVSQEKICHIVRSRKQNSSGTCLHDRGLLAGRTSKRIWQASNVDSDMKILPPDYRLAFIFSIQELLHLYLEMKESIKNVRFALNGAMFLKFGLVFYILIIRGYCCITTLLLRKIMLSLCLFV